MVAIIYTYHTCKAYMYIPTFEVFWPLANQQRAASNSSCLHVENAIFIQEFPAHANY